MRIQLLLLFVVAILCHNAGAQDKTPPGGQAVELKPFVYISGNGLRSPGWLPYTEGFTIMSALNAAGGWNDFGDFRAIYLVRGGIAKKFDLEKIQKHPSKDIPLKPWDIVFLSPDEHAVEMRMHAENASDMQPTEQSPNVAQTESLRSLLDGFPSQSEIERSREICRDQKTKSGKDTSTNSTEQIAQAKNVLELVEKRIPALKTTIKVNTNIFDYPGILGLGRIRVEYLPRGDGAPFRKFKYIQCIGYGSGGFTSRTRLYIEFDEKGVIQSVAHEHYSY